MPELSKQELEEIRARARDGSALHNAAVASYDVPRLLVHINALAAENERLREALKSAYIGLRVGHNDYTDHGMYEGLFGKEADDLRRGMAASEVSAVINNPDGTIPSQRAAERGQWEEIDDV